jgi:hypothetical protein
MKSLTTAILAIFSTLVTANAVDLGNASYGTPYDRYMSPVKSTLASLGKQRPTMDKVNLLMKEGRSFRYHMDHPYLPASPEETARTRTGDCKDKALWLCDQLDDSSVRFVIGKTHRDAKISHAWVLWKNEGRYWILDCTLNRAPIAADTLPADRYVPLYSYAKGSAFRHGMQSSNVAAVATKSRTLVASVASSNRRD